MTTLPQSFPNLKKLTLDANSTHWAAGDMVQVAAGLEAMSGFGQLQELVVFAGHHKFHTPVWQALGKLSQLTSLHVRCDFAGDTGLFSNDVLCLTGCTTLRRLFISPKRGKAISILSQVWPQADPSGSAYAVCLIGMVVVWQSINKIWPWPFGVMPYLVASRLQTDLESFVT